MMKKIALLSTVAALGSFGFGAAGFAQDTNNQPQAPAEQVVPQTPPAMEPTIDDQTAPATPAPSDGAVGTVENEAPATPPPSGAVIPEQAANQVRADTLLGMSVFNAEGEKVGEVKDLLLDDTGKVSGVILSVGGMLGLGAKSVGLNWSEVDVRPDQEMVTIHYTKEQLEAAPDFKTQETQRSESEQPIAPAPSATGNAPADIAPTPDAGNAPAATE